VDPIGLHPPLYQLKKKQTYLHSEDARFESEPEHPLSKLKFLWFSLGSPGQFQDSTLYDICLISFFSSLFNIIECCTVEVSDNVVK
jgi:hypothetical protein